MIGFKAGSFHDEIAALLLEKNPHMVGITGKDITIIDSTDHDPSGLAKLTVSVSGYRGTTVLNYMSLPARYMNNLYCITPIYVKVDKTGKISIRDIWYEYQRMSGITPIESINDVVDGDIMISVPLTGTIEITLRPTMNSPIWINNTVSSGGATVSVGRYHESDLGSLILTSETAPFFNLTNDDDYLKIDANELIADKKAPFKMSTDYFGAGAIQVNEVIMWGAKIPKELANEMTRTSDQFTLSDAGLDMLNEVLVTQGLQPLKHAPVFPAGAVTAWNSGADDYYSYVDDSYIVLRTSVDVNAYISNADESTKVAYVVPATNSPQIGVNFRSCRAAPANQNTFVYTNV